MTTTQRILQPASNFWSGVGGDYDIAVPEIQCNADKIDATVFTIVLGTKTIRVLAYTKQQAQAYISQINLSQ